MSLKLRITCYSSSTCAATPAVTRTCVIMYSIIRVLVKNLSLIAIFILNYCPNFYFVTTLYNKGQFNMAIAVSRGDIKWILQRYSQNSQF